MMPSNFRFCHAPQTMNPVIFWQNEADPITWKGPKMMSHIINTVYCVTESIDGRFRLTVYTNGRAIIQHKETLDILIL